MRKITHACVAVAVVVAYVDSASAQQLKTIPEALASAGHDLVSGATVPSGSPPELDYVLRDTDVIVRGVVGQPRMYLSDDQMNVLSDYPIANPTVLFDAGVASSPRPGAPEITVTLVGGEITIAGLVFTQTPGALPGLQPGSDCLLLLTRSNGKLFIAGDRHFGAFEVREGLLVPLTRVQNFGSTYKGLPASTASASIVKQRRSTR